MNFKKKKYSFPAPGKYKTGEALHDANVPQTAANEPAAPASTEAAQAVLPPEPAATESATGGLSPERAERLLRTVELTRAEIEAALAAQSGARDIAQAAPQQSKTIVEQNKAAAQEDAQTGPAPIKEPARLETVAEQQAAVSVEPFVATEISTPDTAALARELVETTASAPQAGTETLQAEPAAPQTKKTVSGMQPEPDAQPATAVPESGIPSTSEATIEAHPAPEKPDTFWRRLFAPAHLAFLLLAFLLLGPICFVNYSLGNLYYLQEDGETAAVLFSASDSHADVFAKAGIELHEADVVEETALGGSVWLTVTRAYGITVVADGRTYEHKVLGHTTAEALAQLGIAVGPDDMVEPAVDKVLAEGEIVTVRRVVYETREVTETVEWQAVTKDSPLIREGKTQVMNDGGGRDGLADRVYRDKYVDGVLVESEIISERYEDLPWNVVTLSGKDDAIMSPIDGALFTDVTIVDNAPTEYERVLENAVCTAYSFKPGTYGASGMYMFQGFVAVNTNVIPYGSLLYITSPTGNFTYGWAIAADVGEAMMAGYVDIDLFFETYTESALFGKHRLNVYVVDQLTQAELEQFMAQPGMFRTRIPAG